MDKTAPLRIIICIHSFEPGGVERVALRLAAAWQVLGHDVQIVLGREEGRMRADAPPGLRYFRPRPPRLSPAPFETLWMMIVLWRFLRVNRPDILFCPGNSYTVVAVAMKLLLGRRCPLIVAKVSNDLERRDMHPAMRALYRLWLRVQAGCLDRIVGIAEPMRAEIARAMRVDPARIAIIPSPALTLIEVANLHEAHAVRSMPQAGRHFLAIGRLSRQKNFALLLDAFAAGAHAQDRLTLLGEGPERARLESQAERLGIASRVCLPGHVGDPATWFSTADIFILSSDYEGVPAVLLEALASGIPIVATDCSVSMRDLLYHGRFGALVPVGDRAALAAAIADAGSADIDRAAMRARAEDFTLERSAALYADLMRAQRDIAKI